MSDAKLTPLELLELRRLAGPEECERFLGISWDTLRREYPHLIRRISPRRAGIRVADLYRSAMSKRPARNEKTRHRRPGGKERSGRPSGFAKPGRPRLQNGP